MSGSPDSRSGKSNRSGRTSRTSISVKLPTASNLHTTTAQTTVISPYDQTPIHAPPPQTADDSRFIPKKLNSAQLRQHKAVQVIENAWVSYRDRQMYRLLKHAVCAAEYSLSYEILRKVSPREAELIKDKLSMAKVRFRFGGREFPPMIYFKIYTNTSEKGIGLRYLSGKRMIQPASEAARDACELMGHRKFYDQVIQDIIHHDTYKITDDVDVTTLKDYMQYTSLMDETPSYLGGKDNSWRKLTLDVLPRQTIFYDVVEYLYSKKLAPRLQEEIPKLLMKPNNEDTQLEHIRIISEIRSPPMGNYIPKTSPLDSEQGTARRSKQARQRAAKLRKLYGLDKDSIAQHKGKGDAQEFIMGEEDEWDEDEADKLYEWTQELSFDDLTATPRLNTAQFV